MESPNKSFLYIIGTLVVIAAVVVGFYLQDSPETPVNDSASNLVDSASLPVSSVPSEDNIQDEVLDSDVLVIEVRGGNYYFEPEDFKVPLGAEVRLVYINQGGSHDLVIEGYDVATRIVSGAGRDEISFVADKAGEFEIYCSVGNHRALGMTGKLIVE